MKQAHEFKHDVVLYLRHSRPPLECPAHERPVYPEW